MAPHQILFQVTGTVAPAWRLHKDFRGTPLVRSERQFIPDVRPPDRTDL